jgi:erythromycin esterase-like protein
MRPLPLTGSPSDYDPLIQAIGDARLVLIGEASHGTHEFYAIRALITERLIVEKQFKAVAVEADWPDAYRIHRYVHGGGPDRDADAALSGFERFPVWMWRNYDVLEFIEWLKHHDAGFYGMDLYSLNRSRESVINYLDRVDPEAARRARYRYSCFEYFGEDSQDYGYAASFGMSKSCEDDVVAQLVELQKHALEYANRDGRVAQDEFFSAEQNARLVKNAERYYRSMFEARVSSWNIRDQHMSDTLDALAKHVNGRMVVWAHNSHLGDARATDMGRQGEWNVGQLMRERHPGEVFNIGFTTYTGTVTAANNWGEPSQTMYVMPGLPDSYEELFHKTGVRRFLMLTAEQPELRTPLLERAIGVIYRPRTERVSHYFRATLAEQFDAVIHVDETTAVHPLEPLKPEPSREAPETYPAGV